MNLLKLIIFTLGFVLVILPISLYFIFAQRYTFEEIKKFFIIYFRSMIK